MNHADRINQLEKHMKDVQEELNLLKADIAKGEEVDLSLPMGGTGWAVRSADVYGRPVCHWDDNIWVFKTEQEAEWTRRHELAWRKLRFYADKLNPPHYTPRRGEMVFAVEYCYPTGMRVGSYKFPPPPGAELVPFHSREAAERALKELGDEVNYLWSWNRKPEEREQDDKNLYSS